ncbi:MAG: hypothetical protein V1708_06335 [Candidatus Micrarchaeota archaeon]
MAVRGENAIENPLALAYRPKAILSLEKREFRDAYLEAKFLSQKLKRIKAAMPTVTSREVMKQIPADRRPVKPSGPATETEVNAEYKAALTVAVEHGIRLVHQPNAPLDEHAVEWVKQFFQQEHGLLPRDIGQIVAKVALENQITFTQNAVTLLRHAGVRIHTR